MHSMRRAEGPRDPSVADGVGGRAQTSSGGGGGERHAGAKRGVNVDTGPGGKSAGRQDGRRRATVGPESRGREGSSGAGGGEAPDPAGDGYSEPTTRQGRVSNIALPSFPSPSPSFPPPREPGAACPDARPDRKGPSLSRGHGPPRLATDGPPPLSPPVVGRGEVAREAEEVRDPP